MNLSDASVLAVLSEISNDIHIILDASGHVVDANPAFYITLEIHHPIGAPVHLEEFLHVDDKEVFRAFLKASQVKAPAEELLRFPKVAGTAFVQFRSIYHKASGQYLLVGTDISEGQRMKSFLNQIEATSNVGAWDIDLQTNKVYWSDQTYRIHDCDPQSFSPTVEDAIRFYHPDSLTTLQLAVDLLMKNGRPFDLQLKLVTLMGRIIWVRSIAHAELRNGKVTRCYGSFQDITAMREQHDLLKKEVERFNAISNNSPIMMAIIDSEDNVEWTNKSWRKDLGWGSEPQYENADLKQEFFQKTRGVTSMWTDAQVPKASGERVEAIWYRVGLSDNRALLIGKDRTEEQRLHEMLLEQNDQLELAMKVGGLATLKLSAVEGIVQINPEWSKLLGKEFESARESISSWQRAFHPDDFPVAWSEIEACLSGFKEEFQGVFRLQKDSGQFIEVFHRGRIIERNDQGLPTKLLILALDVSKQAALQTALDNAHTEAKLLFDLSLDPLCILDLSGKFIRVNPAFERALGYGEHELIHEQFLSLMHPTEQNAGNSHIEALNAGNLVSEVEMKYKHQNGEFRDFTWSASPDVNSQRIFCYLRDITNQKAAAAIMHQSSKLAALGEMAGGIAHEINNPLTIIQGKSRLIQAALKKEKPDIEKILSDFDRICLTTDRIAKIIRGLRTISRDSSRDPFERAQLTPLIEETIGLCHEKFRFREISVTYECPEELVIPCRPAQVSQILLNLIQNAGDAVEEQTTKWVRVMVEELETTVEISVTDSGPGVPHELRSKIMEPFFTTKETGKGTGLGLSVSRAIAADHGGRLYLDEKSANTKFVIELPKLQTKGAAKAA